MTPKDNLIRFDLRQEQLGHFLVCESIVCNATTMHWEPWSWGTPDAIRTGTPSGFSSTCRRFYIGTAGRLLGFRRLVRRTTTSLHFWMKSRKKKFRFKVPFQQELLPEVGTRRERLATWMTNPQNKAFSRAIVNRVWAMMFGKSLVDPIDDIPLFGERPPGMDLLADDFIQNGYDLRRLIRIIAQTKAFRMAPVAEFEFTDQHESSFCCLS